MKHIIFITERGGISMLVAEHLTKFYPNIKALDDLSLSVPDGAIFGFLGHNGAGKTTALSIFSTLILPSSGKVIIQGMDVVKDNLKVRGILGYLPENVSLYGELTVRENLRFLGRLSEVRKVDQAIDETLEMLGFSQWSDSKVKVLSKGMRQRVGIAQSILHKPKILFLDEPTSGLDPEGTADIRDILLRINSELGTTIFMNTHMLSEVTKICTDIGIISHGRLLLADTLKNVETQYEDCKSLEEIYFRIGNGDAQ
jgi:ABC-2 type transport system ATP-binding protein